MKTLDEQMKEYKNSVWTSFITSVLLIIFALVLSFKEEDIISTAILVLGFLGLIFGVLYLLKYFKLIKENKIYSNDCLKGLLMILFGGVALLKNEDLAQMLAFLLGAYLIYHNASRFQICLNYDSISDGHYWKYLAGISAGCIIPGILILINPFSNVAISHLIAICVIVSSTITFLQNFAMLIGMGRIHEKQTSKE